MTGNGSILLYRPGESALHKGPDGVSRNPEGRDKLILAKLPEWTDMRARIRRTCGAIEAGEADDEDAEGTTIEKVENEDPKKLEPLPSEQGLAVSLDYEKGNRERKFKKPPRGENAPVVAEEIGAISEPPIKTFALELETPYGVAAE